jgi:hypothetical protein
MFTIKNFYLTKLSTVITFLQDEKFEFQQLYNGFKGFFSTKETKNSCIFMALLLYYT